MSRDDTAPHDQSDANGIALGLKRRDPAAAAALVDRFADALFQYALYRVRDTHAAEDIVGDVLARVIEKIDSYEVRPGAPFTAWVFRIAHNRVIDFYRTQSKQREQSLDSLLWSADAAEGMMFSADETFTQTVANRHVLLAALAELPDDQRRVVVLRFVEGRDLDEVTTLLGKSLSAVKALQFRAIQNLRQRLTEADASIEQTGGRHDRRQQR